MMATSVLRRTIVRWAPFAIVVVAITVISLSSSVTQWWAVQSTPGTTSLPEVADPVLRARSNSANADVHTALWFVAGLTLVWAMQPHGRRRLALAALALWAYTGLLEIAQRWVPTRSSQWIDLVGNGLGIAAGLVVGSAAIVVWRRVRGPAAPDGGDGAFEHPVPAR